MQENVVESYGDRFIPSRTSSRLETGFALIDDHRAGRSSPSGGTGSSGGTGNSWQEGDGVGREGQPMLNMLLRSELLGADRVSPKVCAIQ